MIVSFYSTIFQTAHKLNSFVYKILDLRISLQICVKILENLILVVQNGKEKEHTFLLLRCKGVHSNGLR